MTEPSLIEQAIIEHWGDRCPEYEPGCHACEAWKEYDAMTQQNQSPVVTDEWPLASALKLAEAYIEEYEFDSGEAHHVPTETERLLMVDMINGLFSEDVFRAALEAALPSGVRVTHRHKKRGTEYVQIGVGKMQSETWGEPDHALRSVSVDMREVAIYRSVDDGSLWARPIEEFNDGRFEAIEPTQAPQNAHHDDLAVDRFAAAMKDKLAKKRAEGRGGWDRKDECSGAFLSQLLVEHVEKGDPLDVGNLAMMLHQRGEYIADERERYAEQQRRKDQKEGLGR